MTYYELIKANAYEHRDTRNEIKTSDKVDYEKLKPMMKKYYNYLKTNKSKKAIFITSRVHPGEVQASYSVEGCIDFLLSDDPRA